MQHQKGFFSISVVILTALGILVLVGLGYFIFQSTTLVGSTNVSANALTATPTSGPAPLAVTFTSQLPLVGSTFGLNFGDETGAACTGDCSSQAHLQQHVYTSPGTYIAKLTTNCSPTVPDYCPKPLKKTVVGSVIITAK